MHSGGSLIPETYSLVYYSSQRGLGTVVFPLYAINNAGPSCGNLLKEAAEELLTIFYGPEG